MKTCASLLQSAGNSRVRAIGGVLLAVALAGCSGDRQPAKASEAVTLPVSDNGRSTYFLSEFQGKEIAESWIVMKTSSEGKTASEFRIQLACPEILAFSKGSAITTTESAPLDIEPRCDHAAIVRFDELKAALRLAAANPSQKSAMTTEGNEAVLWIAGRRVAAFRRMLIL